ncbi:MAG TPA: FAD-dependent thymidylate synthase [Clostridia bacterium]|nr:FAD-dependent thymidylate synthase [Clostridia bacterium]
MKVTQVAVCPSEASKRAGRPALTPELLAASGARYSRNNEGLESILSKIDPNDLEKSVDSIFRMVDYGHQSIADMVPVAMFIDGVSIWLAYYIWTLCPTAGGQESSTRYIKIAPEGLIAPEKLGIPAAQTAEWQDLMARSFGAYQASLAIWEELARENPAVMGIPRSLLEDPSETAKKKVMRMRRNYAFDRARYFLPVSAATNVMLIMSARGWVYLCQNLLSHPLPEPRALGELIRKELEISAPRMTKHARCTESTQQAIADEYGKWAQMARSKAPFTEAALDPATSSAVPFLSVLMPEGVREEDLVRDLAYHSNRYAPFGTSLQRMGVRFGWSGIGLAEIRDLNRHRTGTKYCPQVPQGFYYALEQIPAAASQAEQKRAELKAQAAIALSTLNKADQLLRQGDPAYIYWSLLGTEYPFEHTTTADKFIYEAELRTGLGAHYRYAKHLRDVLALWYQKFPGTKKLILEGSAEPE